MHVLQPVTHIHIHIKCKICLICHSEGGDKTMENNILHCIYMCKKHATWTSNRLNGWPTLEHANLHEPELNLRIHTICDTVQCVVLGETHDLGDT